MGSSIISDVDLITLGGDPEIVFTNSNGLVSAGKYFPRQERYGQNPEMSGDGHPHIAELRPPPKSHPRQLADEIERIMVTHKDHLPKDVSWRAGSWVEDKSIGGHIHFSGVGGLPIDTILSALDGYLAQIIILMEDLDGARKRRSGKYGNLSDIRPKSWGFEYRTLPSWILSKPISIGVLTLAKAIIFEEAVQGKQSLRKLRGYRLLTVIDICKNSFNTANKNYFITKFPILWSMISNFEYFKTKEGKELWTNVCGLRQIVLNFKNWHNGKDILHRWGVRNKTHTPYIIEDPAEPLLRLDEELDEEEAFRTLFVGAVNEGLFTPDNQVFVIDEHTPEPPEDQGMLRWG